jgi:hypothetical protein
MPTTDPPDPDAPQSAAEEPSAPVAAEPEYESIDAFAEYLIDDDRTTYRPAELVRLMRRTKLSRDAVGAALAAYGFAQSAR